MHHDFIRFKQAIEEANNIVVFVGAGLSTESGIPDFRSPNGVWTRYKPVYFSDFLSHHDARVRYWKMKSDSYQLYKTAKPNKGHEWIYSLERNNKLLGLITQNVDGLHRDVGHSPQKYIEIHGTDKEVVCLDCSKRYNAEPFYENPNTIQHPPQCESCNGFLKPATISFGQSLNEDAMNQSKKWTLQSDLFISIGSSLVVQPAASFPVMAKSNNCSLAIINREQTAYDHLADHLIQCEIGELVDYLLD